MAVDQLLRSTDYTLEELIELVHKSMEGYIVPGKKIAGQHIFYENSKLNRPKHDIIFFWRSLYIQCIDEYDFAMKTFRDWGVYKRFCKNSNVYVTVFKPLWDEEREFKIRSDAMKNVVQSISEGSVKDAQWLESHITKFKGKPSAKVKAKGAKKLKDVIDAVADADAEVSVDTVMDSIENNFKSLN